MAVGSVAVAGASHACTEAGTRRFRRASAAPDTKGKKLGGGARASPPHKTLSGFAICTHYTHSKPAVDQPGGESHESLRGGVGACDGEHGPHVVCQRAESDRELAWRRLCNVGVGSEPVDDGGRVGAGMATQPNASLNALTRSSTTRPIMSPYASLQPFLLGNRFAWQGFSTNVSRLLPSRPRMCSSRL